jgi:hypothetical protein
LIVFLSEPRRAEKIREEKYQGRTEAFFIPALCEEEERTRVPPLEYSSIDKTIQRSSRIPVNTKLEKLIHQWPEASRIRTNHE